MVRTTDDANADDESTDEFPEFTKFTNFGRVPEDGNPDVAGKLWVKTPFVGNPSRFDKSRGFADRYGYKTGHKGDTVHVRIEAGDRAVEFDAEVGYDKVFFPDWVSNLDWVDRAGRTVTVVPTDD